MFNNKLCGQLLDAKNATATPDFPKPAEEDQRGSYCLHQCDKERSDEGDGGE